MIQEVWNGPPGFRPIKSAPPSPAKPLGVSRTKSDSFHIIHKVPLGDTPYVRAKNVQLVDKDPERAIPRCGRLDDQIGLLRHKLYLIQQGMAFSGKRTKTARSQGKKFQVSVHQEATRLLGNLGWALMQQNNYIDAEEAYRRALLLGPDNNKVCNLGICLMKQGRITEAKETLRNVKPAVAEGPRGVDSHLKAYERAQQMLQDLESEMMNKVGGDPVKQTKLFDAFLCSSAIWQPQPCKDQQNRTSTDSSKKIDYHFVDENTNSNIVKPSVEVKNSLNIDAAPFLPIPATAALLPESLKRMRSGNLVNSLIKQPITPETKGEMWADFLPDSKEFEDAIIAAVLSTGHGTRKLGDDTRIPQKKVGKRLKVFQEITPSLSPRGLSSV
ncbi:hypothetical protein F511_00094 [Dorcoceras hygrometricum]|nr:hypothetical protein F511_00094 [Dorcoceras hygrometricum]